MGRESQIWNDGFRGFCATATWDLLQVRSEEWKVKNKRMGFIFALGVSCMAALSAVAFPPIPKESAKALGMTRGKPFVAGVVFVNGKFIEPPYTVERWGTGIRINQTPVTGQVIDWNEFLKTQAGVKVERRTIEPAPAPVEAVTVATSVKDNVDALDALFDDDPKPATPSRPASTSSTSFRSAAPRTEVTYSLNGAFKPNETSRVLLKRINDVRTEIDRILRTGGFICFGNNYSRVTGDNRTLAKMMAVLPDLLQKSETVDEFTAGVRSANLVYLNEVLCEDLFRNRLDYRKLRKRNARIQSADRWERLLQEASDPVF